jgi:HSP20 family protein
MAERTVPTPPPAQRAGVEPDSEGARGDVAMEPTHSEEEFTPPAVDIYEDDQGLMVLADLPGMEPGALDVRVDNGVLTIRGRTQHLATGTPVYREYELTGFFRQFQLPEEIEQAGIEADLKQGVLTLRLPRAAPAPLRRIEVRST